MNKKLNQSQHFLKIDPFRLEEQRDLYARRGLRVKFKETYLHGNPEINNTNSPRQWDTMNKIENFDSNLNPMARHRTNFIGRKISRCFSILDIGFGPGNIEDYLNLRSNTKLVGIDISPESVKIAKKRYPKWRFITGNFLRDKSIKGRFECVLALEVMEHISPSDIFDFLSKVKSHLKPGGMFVVSVPVNEGLESMLKKGVNPNSHVRVYTENIIKAELRLSGFEVKSVTKLYAFHKFYRLKSAIALLFQIFKSPNNLIVVSHAR